ncbi:MAG: hypothetical protein E6H70_13720 [Betaproteobacteria bacterium]|nr:MAG: hypothetical protein E6H70_13720 [Betaproteobacteria bacterium]
MRMRALCKRLMALLRSPAPGHSIGELDARTVQDIGLEVWRGPLGARAEIGRTGLERSNSLI